MIMIQILVIFVFNVNNFTMIIYTFPKRAIEMMLSISLVLVNSYFLVDMIYYYIEMKDVIVIRTDKQTYYKIIVKRFLFCLLCMAMVQCVFNFLAYGNVAFSYAVLYYLLFIMIFYTIYKLCMNVSIDVLVMVFTLFIVILRIVIN